jgi:hypothetical protein
MKNTRCNAIKMASLLTILGFATLANTQKAQALPTIFNTGVDNLGSPLALGANDPHYTSLTTSLAAVVINDQLAPPYVQNAGSKWIWDDANGISTDGSTLHTFRTTFVLTPAEVASGLTLTGQFAADNIGNVFLNSGSTSLGTTLPGGFGISGFLAFASFSGNSGFVAGTNTLDFVVDGNATGTSTGISQAALNVRNVNLAVTGVAAPEPGTLALLTIGGMGVVSRLRLRRRK